VGIKEGPYFRTEESTDGTVDNDACRAVWVFQVEPESPAAIAGIKAGDVITAYGKEKIYRSADLKQLVLSTVPNMRKEIEILRQDSLFTIAVEIGEKSFSSEHRASHYTPTEFASRSRLETIRNVDTTIDSLWKEIELLRSELKRVRRFNTQQR
jgi:serine protease Do